MINCFIRNEEIEEIKKKHKNMQVQQIIRKLTNKKKFLKIQTMLKEIKDAKKKENNLQKPLIKQKINEEKSEFSPFFLPKNIEKKRFSLRNIENISIQSENIEKTLELTNFDTKRASASSLITQAYGLINIRQPKIVLSRIEKKKKTEISEENCYIQKKCDKSFHEKQEENFIIYNSRNTNFKRNYVLKKRNETILHRLNNQILPTNGYLTNQSPRNKSPKHKKYKNNKFCIDSIEILKNKSQEIENLIKEMKENQFKNALEMLKISCCEDNKKKEPLKNTMKSGFVGYLLKSDYFLKQEKKDFLNSKNDFPTKRYYFLEDARSKNYENIDSSKKKTKFSEFENEYDQKQEKRRKLIEIIDNFIRKETFDYYKTSLVSKDNLTKRLNKNIFQESENIRINVFEFYKDLINFHEKEAEIKEIKDELIKNFKNFDENFNEFIKELIKNNEYLKRLENEKKSQDEFILI